MPGAPRAGENPHLDVVRFLQKNRFTFDDGGPCDLAAPSFFEFRFAWDCCCLQWPQFVATPASIPNLLAFINPVSAPALWQGRR